MKVTVFYQSPLLKVSIGRGTFWAETRRKWEGVMPVPGSKSIPGRGNMDQGSGLRVWLGHLRKSKGPVRVCVMNEGEMRVMGRKRWNHMKGLKEDFGFYSGMQEAFGAPSHFRPHRDPTWQHTNKLLRHVLSPGSPSSIAYWLCYSIYFF